MITEDILIIDMKIRKKFMDELKNLNNYQIKLKELEVSLLKDKISIPLKSRLENEKLTLANYINDLSINKNLNLYDAETVEILEKYKKILKIPQQQSFMGKKEKNNSEKDNLIDQYISISSKYIDIEIKRDKKIKCDNCMNKKDFEITDDNFYICSVCYSEQNIVKHRSSYNDIERVNISTKYMYDRKVHFKDCINQYQGKQNCTIQDDVYRKLEEQFRLHHILINSENKYEKFSRITKFHISSFLKELNYPNHYENVHLLHYNFTGKKPDDITYLEEQLLIDFDDLTELYDKRYKNINRKNFINTQYVLFQLLRRHKHKCKEEDFIILKTMDRKSFHDDVCKTLFEELNWNHTPFF